MRALILTFFVAACGATTERDLDAAPRPTLVASDLSAEGLGPIRIGMRGEDVRAILGDVVEEYEANPEHPGCAEWGIGEGVGLLLFNGAVARISAGPPARILTPEGVGVGSTAAEVRAAYPDAERRSAEYTPDPGHELLVWADRENHIGLRFEIGEDERVTDVHAGGDLMNMEGCAGL